MSLTAEPINRRSFLRTATGVGLGTVGVAGLASTGVCIKNLADSKKGEEVLVLSEKEFPQYNGLRDKLEKSPAAITRKEYLTYLDLKGKVEGEKRRTASYFGTAMVSALVAVAAGLEVETVLKGKGSSEEK